MRAIAAINGDPPGKRKLAKRFAAAESDGGCKDERLDRRQRQTEAQRGKPAHRAGWIAVAKPQQPQCGRGEDERPVSARLFRRNCRPC